MKIVLGECGQGFRLVVIDRFYTSVALALQLLAMSVYVLGTIMPIGWNLTDKLWIVGSPAARDRARVIYVFPLCGCPVYGSLSLVGPKARALPRHGSVHGRRHDSPQYQGSWFIRYPVPQACDRLPALDGRG